MYLWTSFAQSQKPLIEMCKPKRTIVLPCPAVSVWTRARLGRQAVIAFAALSLLHGMFGVPGTLAARSEGAPDRGAAGSGDNAVGGAVESAALGKKSSHRQSAREASFTYLQKLDSRNAILKIVPQLIADARKPLKDKANAARLAFDLQYVSKALMFDENDIAATQIQRIAADLCPENATNRALLGDYAIRAGQPEEAAKIFSAVDTSDKADLYAIVLLAQYKVRCSDADGARVLLERFADRDDAKKSPWFQSVRARAWLKCGLNKTAAKFMRDAAELEGSGYCKHLWLGAAAAFDTKPADSRKEIEAAGKVLPDDPLWHVDLYSTLPKDDASKYQNLVDALASGRLYARAYYLNVQYLQSHSQFEQAKKCLDYLARLKPTSADACFTRGRLLRAEGKLQEALAATEEGLKRNPHLAQAYIEESQIYTELKQPEKSDAVIVKMTEMCPHYPRSWQLLGHSFMRRNMLDEAQNAYLKALASMPDKYDEGSVLVKNDVGTIHARLADINYRREKRAEAIDDAEQFNRYKLVLDLPAELSVIHLRPGRLQEKLTLQKEIKISEHVKLADALLEAKDFDNAAIEYRKAIAIDGDNADLHSYLLNVLTEKGDWGGAAGEDLHLSNTLVQHLPKTIDGLLHPKGKAAN